jgi:hypothetical protein
MDFQKFKPGSYVLLRQLESTGNVLTIWGGRVLSVSSKELKILGIEMVYQQEKWHCVGEFTVVTAPPHRVPYQWGFPRLLAQYEANDTDLEARPVIESALAIYEQRKQSQNS